MPAPSTSNPARRTPRRTVPSIPAPPNPNVELSCALYGSGQTALRADTLTTTDNLTIRRGDAFTSGGQTYHRDSHQVCSCRRCGNLSLRDECRATVDRRDGSEALWCPTCRSTHTWECNECDRVVSDDVRMAFRNDDEDHEEPLCPRCAPRVDDIFGRLLNYSCKKISAVPPKDTSSMLYGIEVETHVRNNRPVDEAIRELHRLVGPGYYVTKSDGSLDNGFEIVTRPDSMKVHRAEWLRMFEAISGSAFLKENLRAWSAPRQCCGIHCHIDKSMLSQMQLGKLNVWLNHKNNRTFIEKVAGRGSNGYTSFKDEVRIIDGRRLKSGTTPERYVALNVGQNTAEMRIFRSTLNPQSFFKILDFIEASVEWTGLANCSTMSVTSVADFSSFVHNEGARFPFLLEKLKEWDIAPNKKLLRKF